MVATRLALIIEELISPVQSGFMPHKSTALNTRTLFATLNRISPTVPAAAVLLDSEKAFDSLEWPFLYATMRNLGMPARLLAVIRLLYIQPIACIHLNDTVTKAFPLTRGTRQGCPLSPLLFVIALDPLVRHLLEHHRRCSLQFNSGPLLLTLYADDIILYVRCPDENLTPLLREITRYGTYSGLYINREKSEVLPLTVAPCDRAGDYLLTWCDDSVKYLGVHIHRDRDHIIQLNCGPAVERLECNIDRWLQLSLSMAGRIAIIKTVVLPHFLYLFLNIPILLYNGFFSNLRTLLTRMVWGGKQPRIGWDTLVLPYERGGFGVPNL